jgi:hypothetical protein
VQEGELFADLVSRQLGDTAKKWFGCSEGAGSTGGKRRLLVMFVGEDDERRVRFNLLLGLYSADEVRVERCPKSQAEGWVDCAQVFVVRGSGKLFGKPFNAT